MSFFNKLKDRLSKTKESIDSGFNRVFSTFRTVDEELIEELEEVLILADIGFETVNEITEELRSNIKLKNIKEVEDVKKELKDILQNILTENSIENEDDNSKFQVVLVIGVNGVGKTTSIGKIANLYKLQGKKVLVAAGDTYRAAAVEQLEEWSNRAEVDIIKGRNNEDPASVVFSAVKKGIDEDYDVVICDTAGRLHNKTNLMEELAKINRSIDKVLSDHDNYSKETLLVLDGTVGQNAISQTKAFMEVTNITSLVITKLDGTAKGGSVIAITKETNLPIKYIGVGEAINDLERFNAVDFINAIIE